MAVVESVILTTGWAESTAAAITALAAFFRLPLTVTILVGIVSVGVPPMVLA